MAKLDSMQNKNILVSIGLFVLVVGGSYIYLSYPMFTYVPPAKTAPTGTVSSSTAASDQASSTSPTATGVNATASTSIKLAP